MLLSYNELVDVVKKGYIERVDPVAINAASIDLRLGNVFLREGPGKLVDLGAREPLNWYQTVYENGQEVVLHPGEFILAQTKEVFQMPLFLSMEFSLKSSMARSGLEHLLAGWIDPGFHDSVLTLELRNVSQNHSLILRPGMYIGQVKVFQHTPVPEDASYRARGRYNHDHFVQAIKP